MLDQQSSYQKKIDLKITMITSDKEGYYIMIKRSIQEEDVTIANVYTLNTGAPRYVRQTQTDREGETGSNTVIAGSSSSALTPKGWSSRQKVNKETWLQ